MISNSTNTEHRYLCFDVTKKYFAHVGDSGKSCVSIAAKVSLLAFPIILALAALEGIFDLLVNPFIYLSNTCCNKPIEKKPELPTLKRELNQISDTTTPAPSSPKLLSENPTIDTTSEPKPTTSRSLSKENARQHRKRPYNIKIIRLTEQEQKKGSVRMLRDDDGKNIMVFHFPKLPQDASDAQKEYWSKRTQDLQKQLNRFLVKHREANVLVFQA